ncbi:MAG: hypothetical protein LBE50_05455 [Gallionellaceae bacterium]|jgi:hypothetical protein|nr:hypothetical protein [Gallionellaceae bacterium]
MNLDWAAIGAVVGGFSTLIYTGFTYALLRENRALRKAGSEPRVVAHFEPHPAGNGALQIVLSNVGTGPAMDVSYSFEYDSNDFKNYNILLKYDAERSAITMIGQGEKLRFIFATGFDLFNPRNPKISSHLAPFHIKVNWQSIGSTKAVSKKYLLDVSAYVGLPGVVEKPPMVKVADELESIKKYISKLTSSTILRPDSPDAEILDTTSLEQSSRSSKPIHSPRAPGEPR